MDHPATLSQAQLSGTKPTSIYLHMYYELQELISRPVGKA